jgi:hypothetical protein
VLRTAAVLSIALVLVAGVYCGGQKADQTKTETTEQIAPMPDEALQKLTEEELAKFVAAIPAASAALKAANYTAVQPSEDDQVAVALSKMVDGMKDVAGLNDALVKAGTSWDEFRGTMLRVMAASAALSADMAGEMAAQFAADTTAEAKEMVKKIDALKAACANVPAENKEMVKTRGQDLQGLSQLTQ